jgi:hypothetical protein
MPFSLSLPTRGAQAYPWLAKLPKFLKQAAFAGRFFPFQEKNAR